MTPQEELAAIKEVNEHLHAENKRLVDLMKEDRGAYALERIASSLEGIEQVLFRRFNQ